MSATRSKARASSTDVPPNFITVVCGFTLAEEYKGETQKANRSALLTRSVGPAGRFRRRPEQKG
jgi:hypothetical protein